MAICKKIPDNTLFRYFCERLLYFLCLFKSRKPVIRREAGLLEIYKVLCVGNAY